MPAKLVLAHFDIVGEIINRACKEAQSIPDLSLGNQFANNIILCDAEEMQKALVEADLLRAPVRYGHLPGHCRGISAGFKGKVGHEPTCCPKKQARKALK